MVFATVHLKKEKKKRKSFFFQALIHLPALLQNLAYVHLVVVSQSWETWSHESYLKHIQSVMDQINLSWACTGLVVKCFESFLTV